MNVSSPLTDHTRNLHAVLPKNTKHIADDLVVHFEPELGALRASETEALCQWVDSWRDRDVDALVVMACTAPSARSARVERLRMLRALLARSGVAVDRVRYSGDLIEASTPDLRWSGLSDAVAGTATLKVVSARRAEREVRSIRSYFRAIGSRKGQACTSAS